MEKVKELSVFYDAIREDSRISATHISLYMALFQKWNLIGLENPVRFTSRDIMPLARIDSRATYHRCLKDLVAYGYITYYPSRNPVLQCTVYLKGVTESSY